MKKRILALLLSIVLVLGLVTVSFAANGNGIANDEETKYTGTYTDGVENEEIFKDQVYEGLLSGEATPKFDGREPTRKGYVFAGWKPAVAEK